MSNKLVIPDYNINPFKFQGRASLSLSHFLHPLNFTTNFKSPSFLSPLHRYFTFTLKYRNSSINLVTIPSPHPHSHSLTTAPPTYLPVNQTTSITSLLHLTPSTNQPRIPSLSLLSSPLHSHTTPSTPYNHPLPFPLTLLLSFHSSSPPFPSPIHTSLPPSLVSRLIPSFPLLLVPPPYLSLVSIPTSQLLLSPPTISPSLHPSPLPLSTHQTSW